MYRYHVYEHVLLPSLIYSFTVYLHTQRLIDQKQFVTRAMVRSCGLDSVRVSLLFTIIAVSTDT